MSESCFTRCDNIYSERRHNDGRGGRRRGKNDLSDILFESLHVWSAISCYRVCVCACARTRVTKYVLYISVSRHPDRSLILDPFVYVTHPLRFLASTGQFILKRKKKKENASVRQLIRHVRRSPEKRHSGLIAPPKLNAFTYVNRVHGSFAFTLDTNENIGRKERHARYKLDYLSQERTL